MRSRMKLYFYAFAFTAGSLVLVFGGAPATP